MGLRLTTTAALLPLALLLAGCGSGDESGGSADPSSAGSSSSAAPSTQADETASADPAGPSTCTYAPETRDGYTGDVAPPPEEVEPQGRPAFTLRTNLGDLIGTLDGDAAPCTVASFASLARQGFFDGTTCPRVTQATAGFSVLQCGDPDGPAVGPGYTVPDEATGDETYGPGTLAMANTGQPNSGGSQFFLVYADSALPPTYTVFGSLDDAAVDLISQAASAGVVGGGFDGPPKQPVRISRVDVR